MLDRALVGRAGVDLMPGNRQPSSKPKSSDAACFMMLLARKLVAALLEHMANCRGVE